MPLSTVTGHLKVRYDDLQSALELAVARLAPVDLAVLARDVFAQLARGASEHAVRCCAGAAAASPHMDD